MFCPIPPEPPENGTAKVTNSGSRYGPVCPDIFSPPSCPYNTATYFMQKYPYLNPNRAGYIIVIYSFTERIDNIFFRVKLSGATDNINVTVTRTHLLTQLQYPPLKP